MSESYAGTYRLIPTANPRWRILTKHGRVIGGWSGKGGVYNAANFFGV